MNINMCICRFIGCLCLLKCPLQTVRKEAACFYTDI